MINIIDSFEKKSRLKINKINNKLRNAFKVIIAYSFVSIVLFYVLQVILVFVAGNFNVTEAFQEIFLTYNNGLDIIGTPISIYLPLSYFGYRLLRSRILFIRVLGYAFSLIWLLGLAWVILILSALLDPTVIIGN